jgi:eukaryotic-like serine/threonine-protein kinase
MPRSGFKLTPPITSRPTTPGLGRPLRVRQWELGELVAAGGLTRIYRARPAGSARDLPAPYALKMLRPRWYGDPRAVGLLRREAMIGRSLSHPHVISVLAASVTRPPYYVVMPWLSGSTLKARLFAQQTLPLHVALAVARQVAMGLAALDRAGWMHGDVTPANVSIAPEGHVTLLDLGFARRRDEIGSAVDRCVMGTWTYIAPEMITSALRSDIRSDIYSLGAVLYEMLSGHPPFQAVEPAELARQHRQAVPKPLRDLLPCLPLDVAYLVHRMLAKEPLRRPQSPADVVDQLVRLEIDAFSAWMTP